MAFNDFDLKTARNRFGLTTDENRNLFGHVPAIDVPDRLRDTLNRWVPAAIAMNTEKARSEMIIAPLLMEAVCLAPPPVSLFSGVTFDVDKERGLSGACDYLLTRSLERFFVSQPIVAVVEAKREDISAGLGQCVAEMLAVQLFNEREGSPAIKIAGVVTTGNIWRFLLLEGSVVRIDSLEYYLYQVGQILGILIHLTSGAEAGVLTAADGA